MLCKKNTQMTGLIWPLLTPCYIYTWFLQLIGPRKNTEKLKKRWKMKTISQEKITGIKCSFNIVAHS